MRSRTTGERFSLFGSRVYAELFNLARSAKPSGQPVFGSCGGRETMNLPRFAFAEINPRLGHERVGDAFQVFVHEVLRGEFTQLHLFPTGGKDGAIDLSETTDGSRVVCECKHVGADDLSAVQAEWRSIARRLDEHLADPNGPTRGQSQYSPWYRKAPAMERFFFCTSAHVKNQANADTLKDEIAAYFQGLSRRFPHLSHLAGLKIQVLDWSDLTARITEQPHIIFRWFPKARPNGFVPLEEPAHDASFSAYLRSENLAYYSRSEHAANCPLPAGVLGPGRRCASCEVGRRRQRRDHRHWSRWCRKN